jgi:hypothetical protein
MSRKWRILPLAPTAAFTPFPPVHRTYLETRALGRSDRSSRHRSMAALCAFLPLDRDRGRAGIRIGRWRVVEAKCAWQDADGHGSIAGRPEGALVSAWLDCRMLDRGAGARRWALANRIRPLAQRMVEGVRPGVRSPPLGERIVGGGRCARSRALAKAGVHGARIEGGGRSVRSRALATVSLSNCRRPPGSWSRARGRSARSLPLGEARRPGARSPPLGEALANRMRPLGAWSRA